MQYQKVREGIFKSRPNRFTAVAELDGCEEICHVKNTGRCRELLIPGSKAAFAESGNPGRKTKYDLIAVQKDGRWVNMDSQIPNRAAEQWLGTSGLFSKEARVFRERKYRNSRFDLYVEDGERKAFLEVKGVTLEEEGTARFPDAPTQRGVKHLEELMECIEEGYEAYLIFVIQMKGVHCLKPNWKTHRKFAETLREAERAGVRLMACDCRVGIDFIEIDQKIPIILEEEKDKE